MNLFFLKIITWTMPKIQSLLSVLSCYPLFTTSITLGDAAKQFNKKNKQTETYIPKNILPFLKVTIRR